MKTIEYQITINRPLPEVLALLEVEARLQDLPLGMPAGGYRFEGVRSGTRITLIGDPARDAIHTLADALVRRVFSGLTSGPILARPPIEP